MNELTALVILAGIPNLGSIRIRSLIHRYGSACNALEISADEIREIPGFGNKIVRYWHYWKNHSSWENNLTLAERFRTQIIPYYSPDFPKRLLEIPDHPILLYIRGELKPLDAQGIAVVGTRFSGVYGNETAKEIAEQLASHGFTVVSGLARGIDTAAHHGALRKGRTIAVIGSGLADIYPRENAQLAETIAEHGALISEFPMTTSPNRQNFPQRNRIVSGMTMGTLVIEAPVKSGAMITANKAFSQNRQVFALPGRADDENFRGNHQLIKSGKAILIEDAKDIIEHYSGLFSAKRQPYPVQTVALFEKEEEELIAKLPSEELSIEEIALITKLPINKLNVLLVNLVLKKAIKEFPGKIYKRKAVN